MAIHQCVKHADASGDSRASGNLGEQCGARHSIDLDPRRQRSHRLHYDTSPRDLKDNWLPVTCLVLVAVGLTTTAVAIVAHTLTGMP